MGFGREAFPGLVPLIEGDGTGEGVGIVDDELVSTPAIEIALRSVSPRICDGAYQDLGPSKGTCPE
jgi:hypothetical protein